MSDRLLIPLSQTADLVITHDNMIAVRPGNLSLAQETIDIGPLNDATIENLLYAIQHLKLHA